MGRNLPHGADSNWAGNGRSAAHEPAFDTCYRRTVRDLDMLGSYSITQEMSLAMLHYRLIPHLLEAIQAFKQTHGGQKPSHLLIRTSGVIDVE